MTTEEKILKVSICQKCNGWVRAMSFDYFKESIKARNEFMREVGKYNLSVQEIKLEEWQKSLIEKCECDG